MHVNVKGHQMSSDYVKRSSQLVGMKGSTLSRNSKSAPFEIMVNLAHMHTVAYTQVDHIVLKHVSIHVLVGQRAWTFLSAYSGRSEALRNNCTRYSDPKISFPQTTDELGCALCLSHTDTSKNIHTITDGSNTHARIRAQATSSEQQLDGAFVIFQVEFLSQES